MSPVERIAIEETAAPVAEPLALERNLALMAGAGAGKTYSLMTLCLHLLSGARDGCPALRPSQLFLVTFTDKAAAELRLRLQARLERLASGSPSATEEPELRGSLQRLGKTLPPATFWRKVRDDIGGANIGTFHSICGQLLRRAPPGLGVDPDYELLDERASKGLLEEVTERFVLEALEEDDAEVERLCVELGFRGTSRRPGVVEALSTALVKIREEGLQASEVRISDEEGAVAEFNDALARLRAAHAVATARAPADFSGLLEAYGRALDGLTLDNLFSPERLPALERLVDGNRTLTANRKDAELGAALKRLKWALASTSKSEEPDLVEYCAGVRAARAERAFRRLLEGLQRRHEEALQRRGAMDFTGMLVAARNLLRDHPDVRREVQARMGALLVDEFQDTNRLQLELVVLLSERREGAARAVEASAVLELPLEPGFLCAVGDRKQSIYEFRGADVGVFEQLARRMEGEGGRRSFLRNNWRSAPALLDFFNATFAQLLAPRPEAALDEVAYVPAEDDLEHVRPQQTKVPAVERLLPAAAGERSADCRLQEADLVARRIRQLLDEPEEKPVLCPHRRELRPVRGGDIALLFKRFTHLEIYRQALIREGIPHQVLRGRGFFGAQEVQDVACLLSLLGDSEDSLALAALLRSPFVAWSDASLFKVARTAPRLTLSAVRALEPGFVDADEQRRLSAFASLLVKLRVERDRLGLREIIRLALEESGYRTSLAGLPYGEQALANVEKLLDMAERWDGAGMGDCAAFAAELRSLADDERAEAQADVVEGGDTRAVQLLTVHASKGLEWPIVFVVDSAAQPANIVESVLFDRTEGLSLRASFPERGSTEAGPRHQRITAALTRRKEAEDLRLLYVAATRARDYLLFSGHAPPKSRSHGRSWAGRLEMVLAESAPLRSWVADVQPLERVFAPTQAALPLGESGLPRDAGAKLEQAVARARSPRPVTWREAVFPVTQLADFLLCPRRYRYAHEIGLSENPIVLELMPEPDDDEARGGGGAKAFLDSRAQGTLAHRLLERFDFRLILEGREGVQGKLAALLAAEGLDPSTPESRTLLSDVETFLAGDFARSLADLAPARIHRELPFLLRLTHPDTGGALHLKGQIDLLVEREDGSACIIDYKFSRCPSKGLQPYAFQLDCYALAASRMLADGVPVQTGLVFLRAQSREPHFRNEAGFSPKSVETQLLEAGARLLSFGPGASWPGLAPPECAALECGYRYRCHPGNAA